MKILVLGGSGMLGSAVFNFLSQTGNHEVWATVRNESAQRYFSETSGDIVSGIDVQNLDSLVKLVVEIEPELVINCIGVVKQLEEADDPVRVLPVNSIFPHQLKNICALTRARMIHVSTDCVFSGRKGGYGESDVSDADDLYGKSKFIGEVHDSEHVVTIRTSIIGHELRSNHALVDWFLAQEGTVKGYRRAIFSGLPTVELARIITEKIIPDNELWGLYHVAALPISKYELLQLIATEYKKSIDIQPADEPIIDRSLNSDRFQMATGYVAPGWPELIKLMHSNRIAHIEKTYV